MSSVIVLVCGLFHFEARTIPRQFQNGGVGCELDLGHHCPVVNVQHDDGTVRSAQIDLQPAAQTSIVVVSAHDNGYRLSHSQNLI